MSFLASSSSHVSSAIPTACIRCSERKVRCDKRDPCKACVRHNAQCVFPPAKTSRRKRKLVANNAVDEKLKYYESLLQEHGIHFEHHTSTGEVGRRRESSRLEASEPRDQLPTPTSTGSESRETAFRPQLLQDRKGTRLVDNLWSRVAEEMHDDEDASDDDSAPDASDTRPPNDAASHILGFNTNESSTLHPDVQTIRYLWQTFVDNVNPLTKLVHVPSLQLAIGKKINNVGQAPRGFQALLFAIYSTAVLSLTDEECKRNLGDSRAMVLPRYVGATKAALSRANFMSSTSIVVLQAFFLHIVSIRDAEDARAVWNLTGLAIRVAEGMGMRLDGALLGLPPFTTEIRRRIWWQLVGHDFRAAELCGQPKIRAFDFDETAPKMPANVNDVDMYPTMAQAPPESTKPTEMLWIMMKSELARFAGVQKARLQLGKGGFTSEVHLALDSSDQKNHFVKELENLMETKYIRFCDPTQPLQLWTLVGARLSLNLTRFIWHHPRKWALLDKVPDSERKLVWDIAIQLLEQFDMMQSNPQLRRFAWHMSYFIQWHAVIHVLDVMRADPTHVDADKAWRLIAAVYHNNASLLLGTRKPIFVAVGNLCLKAFNAHAAALARRSAHSPDTPPYITKLREQRQAVRRRRDAMAEISKQREPVARLTKLPIPTTDSTNLECSQMSPEAMASFQSQQLPTSTTPGETILQEGTWGGDDSFWLDDALGNDLFASGPAGMVDVGTDAILAQDTWLDTPNDECIDWAQWDAWLGAPI